MTSEANSAGKALPIEKLLEEEGDTVLEQIIDTGIRARDEESRGHAQGLLKALVDQLIDPGRVVQPGVTRTINERIAAIDKILSEQVNEILHAPDFQALEASWRGLHRFVFSTQTGDQLKIKVLAASKKELLNDFQSAAEFTESALWKKVYQSQYGTYNGDPFGAMVGDMEFGKGPQDVELLTHLSQVAAGAHAPFIASASAQMFGLESFTELQRPRDLRKAFDKSNPDNIKWNSFRDTEDSRYVSLCLPHVLGRLPYGPDNPAESFDFREDADGTEHSNYLWSNVSYAFASRLTDAFAKHNWCVAIRGPEGGGLVDNLPIHTFQTEEGSTSHKCPTETLIPDDREKELSDLGFMALLNAMNTDYAAFFGANSVQKPKVYDDDDVTANAKLSSQLPYLMVTSRIAHYLKAICRDKIGGFMSRGECEKFLNRWISNYVLDQDEATQEQKAKYPLREARIDVVDDKANPGCYSAVAFLRPHFQLDELNISLRLVASLPENTK